ncbi:hypothetical protein Tco_1470639, partial [Tanacetum coccineum]
IQSIDQYRVLGLRIRSIDQYGVLGLRMRSIDQYGVLGLRIWSIGCTDISKLEGTKDSLGVQVLLGSKKCHSPSLIGPIPKKECHVVERKAQVKKKIAHILLTKLAQTSHQRMTCWQSSSVHNLIKRPQLMLK